MKLIIILISCFSFFWDIVRRVLTQQIFMNFIRVLLEIPSSNIWATRVMRYIKAWIRLKTRNLSSRYPNSFNISITRVNRSTHVWWTYIIDVHIATLRWNGLRSLRLWDSLNHYWVIIWNLSTLLWCQVINDYINIWVRVRYLLNFYW